MSIYSFCNKYIRILSKTSNYKNSIRNLPKISTFFNNLSYCGWSYIHINHVIEYTESEILQISKFNLSRIKDKNVKQEYENKINSIMRNKFLKFPYIINESNLVNESNMLKANKRNKNITILDLLILHMSKKLETDGHAQQLELMLKLLLSSESPNNIYYLFFNTLFSMFGYVRRIPKIKRGDHFRNSSSINRNIMTEELTKLKKKSRKTKSVTYIQRTNCLIKANRIKALLKLFKDYKFSDFNYKNMKFSRSTVEHGVYNPSKFTYTKLIQVILVLRNYMYSKITNISK